jgi:hypothetical protein
VAPVASAKGENWTDYIGRLASWLKETQARLILRPAVFPETREDCARVHDLWHQLTS